MPRPPARHVPDADPRVPPVPDDAPDHEARLAELVAGLTGCSPGGALHAVRERGERPADALAVVARAMVLVDQPLPAGLRIPGAGIRAGTTLAHHGSLRRWERLHPGPDGPTADGPVPPRPAVDLTGPVTLDLTDRPEGHHDTGRHDTLAVEAPGDNRPRP